MTITVPQFKIRFPEFSDNTEYPDARVQMFIDDTVMYMGSDETRWCNQYNYAQFYLAAHLLIKGTFSEAGDSSSKSGEVSSKSAGGVSVSYTLVAKDRSDTDNFLISTSYGQQFKNIRDMCFVGVMVAKL
jgi:hypothetical protein